MKIFEKDENGMLHETKFSLEEVSSKGRHVNVHVIQCYVLYTAEEEAEVEKQHQEYLKREEQEKAQRAAHKAELEAKAQENSARQKAIAQAREQAEAAKDNALSLAMSEIARLSQQIEKLTGAS